MFPYKNGLPAAHTAATRLLMLTGCRRNEILALGESLTMIGKLLVRMQVQTTARYAHLARDTVKLAAAGDAG